MRLIALILALAALFFVPFLLLGGELEQLLTGEPLLAAMRAAGGWAWLLGIALLAADLVLPIPATGVMAGLGIVYGPVLGGAVAAAGSFLAGALGYGLCRRYGQGAAQRLLTPVELRRARAIAGRAGGWLVALSRALPLLPEVVACAAGLIGMRPRLFLTALACGSVPMGFAFAALGDIGAETPLPTLALALVLPLLLWPVARRLLASGAPDPALQDQRQPE